ncbi:MAG TPA: phospholipase D-like domain-containing protein, partial [Saprospiraceae bacterium]|nr:phospholipase D-like domain-containing protein [Saprospiraceae bacterium]
SNTALQGIFSFPILYRGGDGIMHNKFMIGDADYPGLAWVWTGSTNFTSGQLTSDPNNAFAIDDQALALNYSKEFDEMWGSGPNHIGAQTGEGKTDNTAHRFQFNGTLLESYFSPSDEVDCHIYEILEGADYQVEIGLLLLTSDNLIDEIIALHHRGVDVRVILEDEASSQNAVQRLAAEGIPMAFHDASLIFHHKYTIIDEGYPDSDPTVVSGSHNWTYSADHINDENTIIFHSQSIANIFRQEFEARWKELYTAVNEPQTRYVSVRLYPVPASDYIQLENPIDQACAITLVDNNGSILQRFRLARQERGTIVLDPKLPSGSYWIRSVWADQVSVAPLVIIRN